MLQAIIFGADGVILNTEQIWDRASRDLLESRGIVADLQKDKHQMTGRSFEESTKIFQDLYGIKDPINNFGTERLAAVKQRYNDVSFMPGFLDFYNNIKNQYATAIATSSNLELFAIADNKLGLTKLFNGHVYYLKNVGNVSKPAPDIFLYAAKMLGIKPSACLVIEDAVNGVQAAKKAGMKCVGLATTHSKDMLTEADIAVDSFDKIDLTIF